MQDKIVCENCGKEAHCGSPLLKEDKSSLLKLLVCKECKCEKCSNEKE